MEELCIWIVQKGNEFYLISATFAKIFDNVHFCYCRTLFEEVVNVFKNYAHVTFIKQEIFGRKTSAHVVWRRQKRKQKNELKK